MICPFQCSFSYFAAFPKKYHLAPNNTKVSSSSHMVSSFPLVLFVQVNGIERRKTMRKAEEQKEAVKNYSEICHLHTLESMKCICLNNAPTTS